MRLTQEVVSSCQSRGRGKARGLTLWVLLCCRVMVKGDRCLPSFVLSEGPAVRKYRLDTHLSCKEWEGAAEPVVSTADMLEKYPCISPVRYLKGTGCDGGVGEGRREEISSSYKGINKSPKKMAGQLMITPLTWAGVWLGRILGVLFP